MRRIFDITPPISEDVAMSSDDPEALGQQASAQGAVWPLAGCDSVRISWTLASRTW